jgi:hypothetical protein
MKLQLPGPVRQFWYLLVRSVTQHLNQPRVRAAVAASPWCHRSLARATAFQTVMLEAFLHILCGIVVGMAFTNENWVRARAAPRSSRPVLKSSRRLYRDCRRSTRRTALISLRIHGARTRPSRAT